MRFTSLVNKCGGPESIVTNDDIRVLCGQKELSDNVERYFNNSKNLTRILFVNML